MTEPTQRVVVYIDGFNLYYGLRAKGWQRYYWLATFTGIRNACPTTCCAQGSGWMAVRYFTARVSPESRDPDKPIRQSAYLEALDTLPNLCIHYGYHQVKKIICHQCGATRKTYEEKMTDVNIAMEVLGDAQNDVYDTAIIMSGDGVKLPGRPRAICHRERYPGKQTVIAFPPGRHSAGLRHV